MFDASAKVSFLLIEITNNVIVKINHCYLHLQLDVQYCDYSKGATAWTTEQHDPSPPGHLRLMP